LSLADMRHINCRLECEGSLRAVENCDCFADKDKSVSLLINSGSLTSLDNKTKLSESNNVRGLPKSASEVLSRQQYAPIV
jgi:hypothetical protein